LRILARGISHIGMPTGKAHCPSAWEHVAQTANAAKAELTREEAVHAFAENDVHRLEPLLNSSLSGWNWWVRPDRANRLLVEGPQAGFPCKHRGEFEDCRPRHRNALTARTTLWRNAERGQNLPQRARTGRSTPTLHRRKRETGLSGNAYRNWGYLARREDADGVNQRAAQFRRETILAPQAGFEPTTPRLTAKRIKQSPVSLRP
jgi:hypothetical protein